MQPHSQPRPATVPCGAASWGQAQGWPVLGLPGGWHSSLSTRCAIKEPAPAFRVPGRVLRSGGSIRSKAADQLDCVQFPPAVGLAVRPAQLPLDRRGDGFSLRAELSQAGNVPDPTHAPTQGTCAGSSIAATVGRPKGTAHAIPDGPPTGLGNKLELAIRHQECHSLGLQCRSRTKLR
jgi:hypothetical protein